MSSYLGTGDILLFISSETLDDTSAMLSKPTGSLSSSLTPYNIVPPFVFAKAETVFYQLFGLSFSKNSLKSIFVDSTLSKSFNRIVSSPMTIIHQIKW